MLWRLHPVTSSLEWAALSVPESHRAGVTRAALDRLGEAPENTVRSMLAAVVANELELGFAALHASPSAEPTSANHPAHKHFKIGTRSSGDATKKDSSRCPSAVTSTRP